MKSVWVLLTALHLSFPALASGPSCYSLFERSETLYVESLEAGYASPLVNRIDSDNLLTVFSHNFIKNNSDVFGAKAVGIAMPGERPQVVFFATGEGHKSWDVHHAEALNVLLKSRGFHDVQRHNISREVLPHVQGYEFTLENVAGRWIITKLRIDSGITQLQIVSQTPLWMASQQALLVEIQRLIPKDLRSFDTPALPPQLQFREWAWLRQRVDLDSFD